MKMFNLIILIFLVIVIIGCSTHSEVTEQEVDYSLFSSPNLTKKVDAGNLNNTILRDISTRAGEETVYPSYYGGSYIMDNGNLMVYVTGDSATNASKFSTYSSPILKLKSVKYSYQELLNLLDSIGNSLSNFPEEIRKNVIAQDIDVINNKVRVFLKDDSNERRKEFLEVFNHPAISFDQMDPIK